MKKLIHAFMDNYAVNLSCYSNGAEWYKEDEQHYKDVFDSIVKLVHECNIARMALFDASLKTVGLEFNQDSVI